MAIELNHTIVYVPDKQASAEFLADLFGLEAPASWGPFLAVELSNGVTLDYHEDGSDRGPQHYAFLVGEDEFDEIFERIQTRGMEYWADPGHRMPNQINTHDGGRGVYFDDPGGHNLEIITRPYGAGR
jgi:catechol 2,3-dioxygenase-like lactoylglutathione lyase family enzyme